MQEIGFEPIHKPGLGRSPLPFGILLRNTVDGIRTRTVYVLSVVPLPFGLQPRTPGGSRTLTDAGLNRMPLPILGYRCIVITPAGLEPCIARLKVSYPDHLDEGALNTVDSPSENL